MRLQHEPRYQALRSAADQAVGEGPRRRPRAPRRAGEGAACDGAAEHRAAFAGRRSGATRQHRAAQRDARPRQLLPRDREGRRRRRSSGRLPRQRAGRRAGAHRPRARTSGSRSSGCRACRARARSVTDQRSAGHLHPAAQRPAHPRRPLGRAADPGALRARATTAPRTSATTSASASSRTTSPQRCSPRRRRRSSSCARRRSRATSRPRTSRRSSTSPTRWPPTGSPTSRHSHLDLPTHFLRTDPEGVIERRTRTTASRSRSDPDGALEGERVSRHWGARQAWQSERLVRAALPVHLDRPRRVLVRDAPRDRRSAHRDHARHDAEPREVLPRPQHVAPHQRSHDRQSARPRSALTVGGGGVAVRGRTRHVLSALPPSQRRSRRSPASTSTTCTGSSSARRRPRGGAVDLNYWALKK